MTIGAAPPTAPTLTLLPGGPPFVIARDSYGNALGGIRLSQHEVATATNQGVNPGPAFPGANCPSNRGFSVPFDSATLTQLYRNHGVYVSAVSHVTNGNLATGYIVPEDAEETKGDAGESSVGKN